MGWYTDRHLELLSLIRKLQNERFLPLKAIKSLIQGATEEFEFSEQQTEVLGELRRLLVTDHRDLVVSEDPSKLAQEMGLSRREQKEL
ncbi:MerR family transcriptional regulator, partial [Escherichia coli]|uniref:MerR family transcriptional regulator n=1 Tax=Escherichia coli TaxID=562 RepID=UPI0021176543